MPSETNDALSTVKRLYAAFDSGDMATIKALIDDKAEWTYHGPDYALPFGGTFHGPGGVADFFRIVDETLTDVHAGQDDFLVSGDIVTVPGFEESTVRSTRGHYRVKNVHIFTVKQNRITQFDEYIDSGEVLEAFTPADPGRGKALFGECSICHGQRAEGNRYVGAPSLRAVDEVYLIRQLRHFRQQVRGSVNDERGWMMFGRANALPGDRAVRDVVSYIETLPDQPSAPAFRSKAAERGERLYRSCAGCHGARAEGVPAVLAPALRGQDRGYLLTQLQNFSRGIRGANLADTAGQRMRAAAQALATDRDRADVIAFIETQ